MRRVDLETMEFEELWLLHEQLTKLLADRITAEKAQLEKRLEKLGRAEKVNSTRITFGGDKTARRKYPKVVPKYCNPQAPTETWSGRGKQPRWLVAALKSGRKLEDFRIASPNQAKSG